MTIVVLRYYIVQPIGIKKLLVLVFVKVQTGPVIFEVPKTPDDIVMLYDQLYYKKCPGHLQVCF
jgi:hypothetical protein